jgi:septal ring factor EnvC (AmiA/AmiB activator)
LNKTCRDIQDIKDKISQEMDAQIRQLTETVWRQKSELEKQNKLISQQSYYIKELRIEIDQSPYKLKELQINSNKLKAEYDKSMNSLKVYKEYSDIRFDFTKVEREENEHVKEKLEILTNEKLEGFNKIEFFGVDNYIKEDLIKFLHSSFPDEANDFYLFGKKGD